MHTFRRRLTYANATATLALLFAMSGGALAAKHYLVSSPKQISPKVLKSFASTNTALFKRLSKTITVARASTAGTATSATTATTAGTAGSANTATSATNAVKAASATDAAQLGGQGASAYALVAQPAFTPATLLPGFSNFEEGFADAGYMKDTLGFVHLRGAMSCPASANTAFILPPGFRPATKLFLPLAVNLGGGGDLEVFENGEARTFIAGVSPHVCGLDGLTFKAEQ